MNVFVIFAVQQTLFSVNLLIPVGAVLAPTRGEAIQEGVRRWPCPTMAAFPWEEVPAPTRLRALERERDMLMWRN